MLSLDRCASPTAYGSPPRPPPSTPAAPPRRLFETQGANPSFSVYPAPPAGGSSIAHIGADIHVIAANASILHVVTPKSTIVKAAGDRLGCVRVMAQRRPIASPPRCTSGEPWADRAPVQLDRAELRGRDSAAGAPGRCLLDSRYLGASTCFIPLDSTSSVVSASSATKPSSPPTCAPPRARRSTAPSPSPPFPAPPSPIPRP
ncbi:hypothetical protein C8R44DRAFT_861954 [Mycena epipterygia]|nr:hypothetical protein C8R44DRAFT_861954 [Mycena epipterygia]